MGKATLTGRKRYYCGDKCGYFVEGTQPIGWVLGTPQCTREKASKSVSQLWETEDYRNSQHSTRHTEEYHNKASENSAKCWQTDRDTRCQSMKLANQKRFAKQEEREKCRERMLNKWADANYASEQSKKIAESHHGLYDTHPEYKQALSNSALKAWENDKEEILAKQYKTKSHNKSWNTSKLEESFYDKLVEEFGKGDIIRQYSSDTRYPFNCDFYIKSQDKFIEIQGTWCHGGHLFNKNDKEDLAKLSEWQEKAKTSKYYQKAIQVWTETDVLKHQIAVENNLNIDFIY